MATEIDSDCLNGVMKGELHFDTVRIPSVVLYFYVFFSLIRTSWGPLPFYSTSPNDHSTQLQLASLLAR